MNHQFISLVNCLLLAGLIHTAFCYNVEEEINELKRLHEEHVKYGALGSQIEPLRDGGSLLEPYCHVKLGCFSTDDDFSDRLIDFRPNSREVVDTKFKLFTRKNPTRAQILSADYPDTIAKSLFDSSRPTQFIVHGFLESTHARWFPKITAELLKNGDYNVINIDWGGLFASKTLYTQATANTRVVGAEIVYLLKTLKEKTGLSYSDVHIIGHSLGAHIAGYAGAGLPNQIGRISGLDPAEPYFQGYNTAVKLDPSDAQFVDVLHSDADSILEVVTLGGGLGTADISGHADFFPNGGEDQPNCKNGIVTNVKLEGDLYEGLRRFVGCDHMRAVAYFIQSINTCPFNSLSCKDYSTFLSGGCSSDCKVSGECNYMGFNAYKPPTPQKYYLQTTGEGSFCTSEYSITVELSHDSSEAAGTVDLILQGANGKKTAVPLTKESMKLTPGEPRTFTVDVDNSVESVVGLEVMWTSDLSLRRIATTLCGQFFNFCADSVKVHEIKVSDITGHSMYFCGTGKELKSEIKTRLRHSTTPC